MQRKKSRGYCRGLSNESRVFGMLYYNYHKKNTKTVIMGN